MIEKHISLKVSEQQVIHIKRKNKSVFTNTSKIFVNSFKFDKCKTYDNQ